MPKGIYPRTENHNKIANEIIKKRYARGEKIGFQKGHKDFVSKESRIRAGLKMKNRKLTKEWKRKIGFANSIALKGKPSAKKGKKFPYLSREKCHLWKGGKIKIKTGYIMIYKPEHPFTTKDGYIMEHRLIMEKILGRYLVKNEIIHHKNGIRNDNRLENLILTVYNKNWHPCLCPKCGFEFLIR